MEQLHVMTWNIAQNRYSSNHAFIINQWVRDFVRYGLFVICLQECSPEQGETIYNALNGGGKLTRYPDNDYMLSDPWAGQLIITNAAAIDGTRWTFDRRWIKTQHERAHRGIISIMIQFGNRKIVIVNRHYNMGQVKDYGERLEDKLCELQGLIDFENTIRQYYEHKHRYFDIIHCGDFNWECPTGSPFPGRHKDPDRLFYNRVEELGYQIVSDTREENERGAQSIDHILYKCQGPHHLANEGGKSCLLGRGGCFLYKKMPTWLTRSITRDPPQRGKTGWAGESKWWATKVSDHIPICATFQKDWSQERGGQTKRNKRKRRSRRKTTKSRRRKSRRPSKRRRTRRRSNKKISE